MIVVHFFIQRLAGISINGCFLVSFATLGVHLQKKKHATFRWLKLFFCSNYTLNWKVNRIIIFFSSRFWRTCRLTGMSLHLVCVSISSNLHQLWSFYRWVELHIFTSLPTCSRYNFLAGVGVGLTRDASTLMVGQYFKRRRDLVEIFVVSGSGLGIIICSVGLHSALRSVVALIIIILNANSFIISIPLSPYGFTIFEKILPWRSKVLLQPSSPFNFTLVQSSEVPLKKIC